MIINAETAAFIKAHASDDILKLALKKVSEGVDLPLAITQIDGRQRAQKKLPTLAATDGIIYPPHISMEQCSSEATALYKAELAKRLKEEASDKGSIYGNTLVDLTGGFGIDFIYMSRSFSEATYIEQQENLCTIAQENFDLLKMDNARIINGDGTEYLKDMQPVDTVYLDPARRNIVGEKVFAIRDCTPNVLEFMPTLKKKARHIIIKLSPMFDWCRAMCEVGHRVSEVHIVSVMGECKELLLVVEDAPFAYQKIYCVNLGEQPEIYIFDTKDSMGKMPHDPVVFGKNCPFSLEQSRYLLVPNASVMKSMEFVLLSEQFRLPQVAPESHYYLSDKEVEGFPGKKYEIIAISTMNKRELREKLSGISSANIATRNFPLPVAELRKRLKLADGGDTYIFATTTYAGDHLLFICKKC